MAVNEIVATRLRRAWRVATAARLAAAVLVAPSWFAAPVAATAQGQDGFYLRIDFGDSDALTFRGSFKGVDLPTRCDRLLRSGPTMVSPDPACTGLGSEVFATVRFDRGAETMTSATALALGYARGRIRLEAELNNTALGGTSAPLLDAGALAAENVSEWSAVEPPSARVSGLTLSDVFLNVHLDFDNSSRFTPFVGVGGGGSTVVLAFEALRVRRTLASGFAPAGGVDPAAGMAIPAWQTRAAGTADYMSLLLAESTLGANVIGGVAWESSERFSVALRGRYARYRDVRKPGHWDLLRSHAPMLEAGGRPAAFDLELGDIAFYAVSVSLVYDF